MELGETTLIQMSGCNFAKEQISVNCIYVYLFIYLMVGGAIIYFEVIGSTLQGTPPNWWWQ